MDTIFKDKKGTEWDLEITLSSARRVDKSDFTSLTDKKFSFLSPDKDIFGEMISNGPLICAIAAIILAPQMKEKLGLDYDPLNDWEKAEEAFQQRLNGEAIRALKIAYLRALQDFFPEQKTVLSTLTNQYEKAMKEMSLLMVEAGPKIEEVVDLTIAQEKKNFLNVIETEKRKLGERSTKSSESLDGDQNKQSESLSEDSSPSMIPSS